MDQSAIAAALGISRQTVSNYERGLTSPKRGIVSAWALATGVDAEWLATGNETTQGPDGGAVRPVTHRYRRFALVGDMETAA